MKPTILLLLTLGTSAAQTCTVLNYSACPTTGLYAGPPTLQSFVQGASQVLPAAGNAVSGSAQPRMIVTAQLVPAGESYMTADPMTCGGNSPGGTCYFNVIGDAPNYHGGAPSGIIGYLYRLSAQPPNGVGLSQVDVNMWMGPLFKASQWNAACAAYGGGSCSPTIGSTYSTWYLNGLATYDAMFAYAANAGVLINIAPELTSDVLMACGITKGLGNYTEAQMQNCLAPLIAAATARWNINHVSVLHEPCGVMSLIMNTGTACFLGVTDVDTMIAALSVAARWGSPGTLTRQNPSMLVGAAATIGDVGALPYACPGANNYWCDWTTNLSGSLDYYALHAYPFQNVNNYTSKALVDYAAMGASVPANRQWLSDESSPLRFAPAGGGSEGSTYLGCGASEWQTDGTFAWWAENIVGKWAPAAGLKSWSLFPSMPLLYVSSDPNNTHCSQSSDTYPQLAMQHLGDGLTKEGIVFSQVAHGGTAALEGAAQLTRRTRLGH